MNDTHVIERTQGMMLSRACSRPHPFAAADDVNDAKDGFPFTERKQLTLSRRRSNAARRGLPRERGPMRLCNHVTSLGEPTLVRAGRSEAHANG